jgi:hypothetical protein
MLTWNICPYRRRGIALFQRWGRLMPYSPQTLLRLLKVIQKKGLAANA